jgi:hypothetical protein
MAKLEKCQGCGVDFKHHELTRHRKVMKCGVEYPIKATIIKNILKMEKEFRRG